MVVVCGVTPLCCPLGMTDFIVISDIYCEFVMLAKNTIKNIYKYLHDFFLCHRSVTVWNDLLNERLACTNVLIFKVDHNAVIYLNSVRVLDKLFCVCAYLFTSCTSCT